MSAPTSSGQPRKVVPAHLGFLAIYNPSLGTTDETLEDQIVYYSPPNTSTNDKHQRPTEDWIREQHNEQLRQIGLAQGMIEFGRSFSNGKAVDTVETEKSRIVLHELEAGWWILASIALTTLPSTTKTPAGKGKSIEQQETVEYSSREVKPTILLLGDLLRAHSIFLLHHASSLSVLYARTRRAKYISILGRYWDTFLSTWNVLMHGNPANTLYRGIKLAACGELGVGVGEEDRGSGERDVLEGFVGRIGGLVDVIVFKFGEGDPIDGPRDEASRTELSGPQSNGLWLGSGNEPAAEDGAIFLGTGALSRKSLRDVSHWIEDLYRWGPYAYGVIDNPSSNPRTKKTKHKQPRKPKEPTQEVLPNTRQVYGLSPLDTKQNSMLIHDGGSPESLESRKRRPSLRRGPSDFTSSDSDASKGNTFVNFLKLGYGTHWTLGGTAPKVNGDSPQESDAKKEEARGNLKERQEEHLSDAERASANTPFSFDTSGGHYLIGLLGDIESVDEDISRPDSLALEQPTNADDGNARFLLRTLALELERGEEARAEADMSIDLENDETEPSSSKLAGPEHTGTFNSLLESQDSSRSKKLHIVVYVHKPFIFVFLFELRADILAQSSLYRSLHHQIRPLIKPLLTSTTYRASKPDVSSTDNSTTPIYDLVWDPKLLTLNSTIPNIPDPILIPSPTQDSLAWSRVEALNTHMQIINTYIASSNDASQLERTCKTSRGWWVVWTRVPDPEPRQPSLASGLVPVPGLISEDTTDENQAPPTLNPVIAPSRETSTHEFLGNGINEKNGPRDKEIFLIRRASDYAAAKSSTRFVSGSQSAASGEGWILGPGKLAQGIGVDTKRYIEGLLNLNR